MEPSGPVQARNGIALPYPTIYDIHINETFKLPFAHKAPKSENEHFLLFSDNTSRCFIQLLIYFVNKRDVRNIQSRRKTGYIFRLIKNSMMA
jgi:hypothetical protein